MVKTRQDKSRDLCNKTDKKTFSFKFQDEDQSHQTAIGTTEPNCTTTNQSTSQNYNNNSLNYSKSKINNENNQNNINTILKRTSKFINYFFKN